jgi:phosphate transport system protein
MVQPMEGHTVHRYDGELNNLHLMVLEMGGLALEQTRMALQILKEKDLTLAHTVMEHEHEIDEFEVNVDNEIVSVIARRCPVAKDLRVIMAMSKSVTDLERIGDEAARIANIAVNVYDNDRSDPSMHLLRDINTMGKLSLTMLKEALGLFDSLDSTRAEQLLRDHNELDAEFQSSLRRLSTFLLEDARNVGHTVSIVLIIKALERIGDHAKNLAEYVIFLIKGEDVRHQSKEQNNDMGDELKDSDAG